MNLETRDLTFDSIEAPENSSHEDHGAPAASTRPPLVPDSTRTPDTRDEAVSWYLLELKGNITLVHHRMDQFVLYLRYSMIFKYNFILKVSTPTA